MPHRTRDLPAATDTGCSDIERRPPMLGVTTPGG
jgi:hypothetical protein